MASAGMSSSDRVEALIRHLALERVHLAACMSGDWGELVAKYPHRICSLTVVAPHLNKGVPEGLDAFGAPSLVVTGDQGAPAQRARALAGKFGRGRVAEIRGYASPPWADTVADRLEEVAQAIQEFLASAEREGPAPTAIASPDEGEIAGIRYSVQGRGPALMLMPLCLAPSQWDPLIPWLAEHYSVIRLGGPHLGVIALLEARAASGYGDLVAQVLDQTGLSPGETVLEVGCGSGALARALAKRSRGSNSIVATDINPYLLSEARDLTAKAGLSEAIKYEEANAEALPYPDASIDVAVCCTVLEEGDADKMIAELARVTRPGGRVAVVTRVIDVDWWTSLPVPRELKSKINALGPTTSSGIGEHGCADGSLYARLTKVGLTPLVQGPQFAIYRDGERLADVLDRLVAALSESEARMCRNAIEQAEKAEALFVAEPFHCAVGRK